MNRSKCIGTRAESIVVKVAQRNGFLYARRSVLSGASDKGDIHLGDGTDAVIEVKGGKQCESLTPAKMAKWVAETRVEMKNAGAKYAFLVTQVAGIGEARAENWLAHVTWEVYEDLTGFRIPNEYTTMSLGAALEQVKLAIDGT